MKTKFISDNITRVLASLYLIFSISSCQKVLDVPTPANEILVKQSFNDSVSATGAVTGIYSKILSHSQFEWGGITLHTSRGADELKSTQNADDFELNTLSAGTTLISYAWSQPYSTLLVINTSIEGLTASAALNSNVKRRLLGECYFDRAFINFYLVNLWGDAAALTTTSNMVINTAAPSTPTAAMYAQIISDLKQAQTMMTNTYPSSGAIRPNAMAATALLARVYLYNKQYSDAIAQSAAVINSGLYSLPAPASAFLSASSETILSLQPNPLPSPTFGVTADGQNFLPLFGFLPPNYALTSQLSSAFESGDQRKAQWTKTVTLFRAPSPGAPPQLITYTYPTKYKANPFNGRAGTENYVLLRLAEQYLIRAEAEMNMGDITDAVTDLNVIRSRAGLTGLPSSLSQAACQAAVEQECRIEFFAEWGHRWLDLKRWPATDGSSTTRADQVLSAIKPAWQSIQKLYPLPQLQLQYDHFLKQNPGY